MRFTEADLRRDIVDVWGPHGAHTDLYDSLLRKIHEQGLMIAEMRALLDQIGVGKVVTDD